MSNVTDFPVGKPTNNFSSFGRDGHLPPELAAASTMAEDIPNLQPGDLVLFMEDKASPIFWLTAVVTETHPGEDNNVRVVTLGFPKGIFKRSITKIHFFPLVNNE
jgi:hypothetical protein